MTTTSTEPFHVPAGPQDVITLLRPSLWSDSWSGTSDHVGVAGDIVLVLAATATPWSVPYTMLAATPAEQVARLRDRVMAVAGLSKQEIAHAIGIDRRSLSGFVTGEIRPSTLRLRSLEVLAESAEWASARFGPRAGDILRKNPGSGSPLDLIASGRTGLVGDMEAAAEALGLIRTGAVSVRPRGTSRLPLYLEAREVWANRLDQPAAGGRVREPAAYEQDLSKAAKAVPGSGRPRRKQL